MLQVKSISNTEKTATIKFERRSSDDDSKINALYALSGGYNQVARHVDIERYNELARQYNVLIAEMAGIL